MSRPRRRHHPYLDAPLPLAISHRGQAPDALENTVLAFQRAVDLGYGYLETDVRATSDGVLVVFHDATLDRVTDRGGRVADLPWREVGRALVAGQEPVPRLEDCLEAFPQVRFNIDVKADDTVEPLVRTLRRTKALDRVCVASFSDRRLSVVRRALGPAVATSLGPASATALWSASRASLLRVLTPPHGVCAQVPQRAGPLRVVDRRFVEHAHAAGLQVHVWTVDEASEMNRLLDLGADGIVTDRADVLREVLLHRGTWTE